MLETGLIMSLELRYHAAWGTPVIIAERSDIELRLAVLVRDFQNGIQVQA